MAQKVRFELNIDEIIECTQFPSNDNVAFFGEQATGKTFLFVDKLTGDKQVSVCIEPASESKTYAKTATFFLPPETVIIDENEKDAKHEALMSHIQDCCDKVCKTAQHFDECNSERYNQVMEGLKGIFDELAEHGTSNGISEKTLLDALRIVSKNRD